MKMVIYSSFILLRCATVQYPSTKQSRHPNCTVNPSKYHGKNQEIHFHYHYQAHLIHYFIQDHVDAIINACVPM